MPAKQIKPIYAWALATRGQLSIFDLSETRDDALAYQNKPAWQRVVEVKISVVKPARRRKSK